MKYIFKTIIQNFIRKPATNLINLMGLSISLTLVIILTVYCYSELTTDSFQKNGDRVFLYGFEDNVYTPGILKDHIDLKVPEVESTVRIGVPWEPPVFQAENKEPIISDLIFADEDFFNLFTYNFIEGNDKTAMKDPLTIVITKTLSNKIFGNEVALGKTIRLNNDKSLTVSGVIEEPNANFCLRFNAITNIETRKIVQESTGEYTDWGYYNFQTFILLKKGVNPDKTLSTILSLFPQEAQKNFSKDYFLNIKLIPLRKVYFSRAWLFDDGYLVIGDRKKIHILLLVASLVLLIALINFINISSSHWQEKIKQTGVMKIMGAKKSYVLYNILLESFLFFLTALFIAIQFVNTVYPKIKDYTSIHYDQKLINSPGFIIISLGIIIILSITFSIIPALRISSSRVVDNLKKTVIHGKTNFSIRGVLVTIQFTIAIILISFTFLIQKQIRFGSNNLGFNQKSIIGIKLTEQLIQKKDVLKNQLEGNSSIKKVSFSQFFPGKTFSWWGGRELTLKGEKKPVSSDTFSADAEFFEMLGLQLVSGRLFTDNLASDKNKIVVNETFLLKNSITNPLGGTIINRDSSRAEIIGIIKDFHYKPVNQPIGSLSIKNDTYASYCLANIQTNDYKSLYVTVEKIKKTISELSPSFPVEVSFFDQAIESMYQSELRFRRTFSLFSICAIIICCLGILAISIFACQRRVKEIGIRKVNGAKIYEILIMLNKDFIKWVGIAFVIACPIAWFVMYKWLQGFAYKTELSWWIFVLTGILALIIALLTVSWQSWRVATKNPVEALRYE